MTPYYQDDWVTLYHGTWQDVLASGVVPKVDAVITDPPFSDRTHKGQLGRRKEAAYTTGGRPTLASRGIEYTHWTDGDVEDFVSAVSPLCKGCFCALTSHDLCRTYEQALVAAGRYAFSPVACVQMYRNVRLTGDGPSNWADRLMVARPTSLSKWGALPGAYVGKPFDDGQNMLDRSQRITGGKPIWLMRAIVSDYSREGDLILDPCAGRATTAVAARALGRRCIVVERDEATCGLAKRWLLETASQGDMFRPGSLVGEQPAGWFD